MTFARRTLLTLGFTILLAGLAPRLCQAQPAPAPIAAPTAQSQPAAQAYSLPADKLAKAIALSRIRNILDITGSIWGLIFLWLLLATRAAAALAGWAERLLRRRWMQGLLFFAAFLIISTLAGIPFDILGHHFSRSYGISVQGWGGWTWDQAKALGLHDSVWRACAAALQLDRAPLAAPLLAGDLAGDHSAADSQHLCVAAAGTHLQQI